MSNFRPGWDGKHYTPMNLQEFIEKLDSASSQEILRFDKEFHALMLNFEIKKVLSQQLKNCLDNYKNPPPVLTSTTLSLASGTWFSINLTVDYLEKFSSAIISHSDTVLWFLTPVEFNLFVLEKFNKGVFSHDARIKLSKQGNFIVGDMFVIDSNKHVLSMRSEKPIVVISLSKKFNDEFGWKFDVDSGKPICHFNINPDITVTELILKFLGLYGDESCINSLRAMLYHGSDSVKWQAATALAHLNQNEGLMAFQLLASSTNPLLSKAAMSTINQIEDLA